jgi:hypothetical protein
VGRLPIGDPSELTKRLGIDSGNQSLAGRRYHLPVACVADAPDCPDLLQGYAQALSVRHGNSLASFEDADCSIPRWRQGGTGRPWTTPDSA